MLILANQDYNHNEIQNAVIQNLSSAPSSPVEGQVYYDTTAHALYVRNNSTWVAAGGVLSAYSNMTDGSTTAAASASDTFKFRSANNRLTVAVGSNDVTHGDNLLLTLNEGNIVHNSLSGLTTGDPHTQYLLADGSRALAGNLAAGGNKITGAADPTSAQDVATKAYVDSVTQGLAPKGSAAAATTAALAANTYANGTSGVGATLTGNSNGALAAIDGYTASAGDVLLIKNEATGSHNGLYTVTTVGDGSHAYVLTRSVNMDAAGEIAGAYVFVLNGTTNANQGWVIDSAGPYTVGTTTITFSQFTGVADITPGTGLSKSGNTISIDTAWIGQAAITTLGTISTGTWSATTIALNKGGTGATTAAAARSALGTPGKYSATIGDGSSTTITITQATHGLAADSTNHVTVMDATSGEVVFPNVTIAPGTGNVSIVFAVAPTSNQYRVTIVG